jgi:RepB DNA-primase from phage plasmid/CHC2 zinc finger
MNNAPSPTGYCPANRRNNVGLSLITAQAGRIPPHTPDTMSETNELAAMRYLRMLTGNTSNRRFLEVRYRVPDGMAQLWTPTARYSRLPEKLIRLARTTDVYVGVAPRARKQGTNDAIAESHLLWVEIDTADALERLDAFKLAPSMVINSGTAGHVHAYWQLTAPLDSTLVSSHNRALARGLGGDLASTDAARILRPPGTLNHKHDPHQPVEIVRSDLSRHYSADELLSCLPAQARQEPRRPRAQHTTPASRTGHDRLLLGIPASEWAHQLTGAEPDRTGKIRCPFHNDRTPSLHLYDNGTWYCFGACRTGGTIYDFAARLWGMETTGRDFLELRDRLLGELLALVDVSA